MTSFSAGHIILTPTQPVEQLATAGVKPRSHALYRLSYRTPPPPPVTLPLDESQQMSNVILVTKCDDVSSWLDESQQMSNITLVTKCDDVFYRLIRTNK